MLYYIFQVDNYKQDNNNLYNNQVEITETSLMIGQNQSTLSETRKREDSALRTTHYTDTIFRGQAPANSMLKMFVYVFIISLSSTNLGFTLTIISASNLDSINKYYHVNLSHTMLLSLLNGVLPFGGMFGSLFIPYFLAMPYKKSMHIVLSIMTAAASTITVLPSFGACLIGRFCLGALISVYMSAATLYIKQITPFYLRKPISAIFSWCRIGGFSLCYILSHFVFEVQDNETHFIYSFFGPPIISLIQLILILIFVPQSPFDLVKKNKASKAEQIVKILYRQDYFEQKMAWIKFKIEDSKFEKQPICPSYRQYYAAALHLALLRQFCGQVFIILHFKILIQQINGEKQYSRAVVLVNSMNVVAAFIGIFLLVMFRRKTLVFIGSIGLCLVDIAIATADYYENVTLFICFTALFMVNCGSCVSCVAWFYPAQVAKPEEGRHISLLNWFAGFLVTFVPPFILGQFGNGYPLFSFFAFYLIFASFINFFIIKEPSVQSLTALKRRRVRRNEIQMALNS